MLIIVILIGLILVMGIVGLVVMRRGNNNTDDYLYEDEEDSKAYASLPGQYEQSAAPPADVSPEMAEAMRSSRSGRKKRFKATSTKVGTSTCKTG